MNSILYTALTALDTFSDSWQVTANNVANVSTGGFMPSQARYEDVPDGRGVRLGEVRRSSPTPGVPLEGHGEYVNSVSRARAEEAALLAAEESAALARRAEQEAVAQVELEREMTQAIITENAYAANALLARTYDDMMGTVLDIVV